MSIQGLFPLELTSLNSLLSKGQSTVFTSITIWKHQFCGALPSLWSNSHLHMTTKKTIALTIWIFISKLISLLFNTLSRFLITFPPRSNCLLILWLKSPGESIQLQIKESLTNITWYYCACQWQFLVWSFSVFWPELLASALCMHPLMDTQVSGKLEILIVDIMAFEGDFEKKLAYIRCLYYFTLLNYVLWKLKPVRS